MKHHLTKLFYLFPLIVLSNQQVRQYRSTNRIIGGTTAEAGQYPFVAAINVQTSNGRFFCGGTLISTEWIITAGQCIANATSFTISLGSNSLNDQDANKVTVTTSNSVLHPGFNSTTLENDIGLIKLQESIKYGDNLQRVDLIGLFSIMPGTRLLALGWGQTSDDDTDLSNYLQWVQLTSISTANCQSFYGNQVNDFTLCVRGNSTEGSCYGDTGGPLMLDVAAGGLYLMHVGIASFVSGNGCESSDPSGYLRTYYYINWIRNVTGVMT